MSAKQNEVLKYVSIYQGVSAADVARHEGYGGAPRRGHSGSYARVKRMIRRGILITGPCTTSVNGVGLWCGK